ncbi:MAG: FtsQ-type POTRA domain-containing protein [Caldilineaceae bacterium]|nr:FtsQ-type POTRA domain-containing protein [Caldilineaceae bacterium]
MARITFPQTLALRSTGVRTSKAQTNKERTTKPRASKEQRTSTPRATSKRPTSQPSGQASLLLSSTAQLRSGERAIQQDAQRRARRRRQVARQYRQVEALVQRISLPKFDQWHWRWPVRWQMSEWRASKAISALLCVAMIALISWVHVDEQWFVYRDATLIQGLTHLNADELYEQSGIDSWNIFWLSPRAIRARMIALPTVADAQVTLQLPNQVIIQVQEEQPVAMWVTQAGNFWLLPDGTALPEPENSPTTLLQIIDPTRDARSWATPDSGNMDVNILKSAQALTNYLPTVNQIYFNQGYGLNFHMPDSNLWVYWGDGLNMTKKYNNMVAVERHLRTTDNKSNIIDVRFDKPVLK